MARNNSLHNLHKKCSITLEQEKHLQVQPTRRKRNRVIVNKYVNTKTGAIRSLPHTFVTVWESEEHKPTCEPTIYINVIRGIRSKQAMSFFSREVYIRDLTTGKIGYL